MKGNQRKSSTGENIGGSLRWTQTPLWTLFSRCSRKGFEQETLLSVYREHGVVPKSSRNDNFNRASDDLSAYQLVEPGDLVVNKMKAWQGSVSISRFRGIVSPAYFVYRPLHDLDGQYLHYLLRSGPMTAVYKSISHGVRPGQWDLEPFAFSRIKIALPSIETQTQISQYLDVETARIDTLIDKQRELADRLGERRRALPSERMSHLIGHGERLKWCLSERDERAGREWLHLPLLSVSINWGVKRRDTVTSDLSRAEDLSGYKICRRGDLVVNRMRAFQGAIGVAAEDGVVSPDYSVIRVGQQLDSVWLEFLMRTSGFVSEMSSRIRGIGGTDGGNVRTPRLNIRDLLDIRVEIPSLDAQLSDTEEWARDHQRIDTLMAKVEAFIETTKERRAALITAAVTGKIDVRKQTVRG